MRHISIVGEYRTQAWFGPTRPKPFRYPVCSYDPAREDDREFAVCAKDGAIESHTRVGIVIHGFEEFEDGLSYEEWARQERQAARAERLRCDEYHELY